MTKRMCMFQSKNKVPPKCSTDERNSQFFWSNRNSEDFRVVSPRIMQRNPWKDAWYPTQAKAKVEKVASNV